ncbi:hypothetical protein H9639_15115 [Arthrobacter sp. Sa2CUA1]|uniref:Uncharacterized protein n=1 Tax=Arthrobacter gallicola TaxID=2762225 RepID=A0ABR8UVP0_9MICC|nr:hypothetical protein [Arthrobacter gallicola]MBD7996627.1 hypothetical protein [Arthrobacter gallicola]
MGNQHFGGAPHAAAELIAAVRGMEAAGIPHPKVYVMTVLQAAKTLLAAGDREQGSALCERAWAFTESVPALNHDREVAVHVYDAGWDHRRPRDVNYLTGAFSLALEEFGPASGWIPHLMRELHGYVQDQGGWRGFGSLQDPGLAAQVIQVAEAGLREFAPGTDLEERRLRGEVAGYATALLFSAGDEQWPAALQEWFSTPVSEFEPSTALFTFLLDQQAYDPARELAERTLQAVEADPASSDAQRAGAVLDAAFSIVMAPDAAGLARLPELEERAGALAHGTFSDEEALLLQEKLSRYIHGRMAGGGAAQPDQQAMFDRLRFNPFTAGSDAGN